MAAITSGIHSIHRADPINDLEPLKKAIKHLDEDTTGYIPAMGSPEEKKEKTIRSLEVSMKNCSLYILRFGKDKKEARASVKSLLGKVNTGIEFLNAKLLAKEIELSKAQRELRSGKKINKLNKELDLINDKYESLLNVGLHIQNYTSRTGHYVYLTAKHTSTLKKYIPSCKVKSSRKEVSERIIKSVSSASPAGFAIWMIFKMMMLLGKKLQALFTANNAKATSSVDPIPTLSRRITTIPELDTEV